MLHKLEVHKDKGLAWAVLFMSFLAHFGSIGFSFGVIGNLTIIHMKLFNISQSESGNIGSVHVGLIYAFG